MFEVLIRRDKHLKLTGTSGGYGDDRSDFILVNIAEWPSVSALEACLLRLLAILIVAYFFQPVHGLAIELLLDGDMRQSNGRSGTVPVFLARWEPDYVTWPNLFDRSSPALDPAATGGDDEGLAQGMSVPGGSGSRLKRDDRARDPRGLGSLERGVKAYRASEPVGRACAGGL